MLKIILFMISMFLIGFLIVQENWHMTISAFGYEITLSTILLVVLIGILLYLLKLLKKPFIWLFGLKNKRATAHLVKKEAYLTFVLETLLDQNNESIAAILKQKKGMLQKKDIKHLLLTALFNPSKDIYEELLKQKETELAGIRGLYFLSKEEGNLKEAEKLLSKAEQNHSNVFWVLQESYEIAVLQRDWHQALILLEKLYKLKQIKKEDYTIQKSNLFFMLGRIQEAYQLDKKNPSFAIAYANQNPKNALTALTYSWNKEPSFEVYQAYMEHFKSLTPDKQIKAVQKLISKNKEFRISLIALADTAIRVEKWRLAKETLSAYLQSYPLTKNVADMMAKVSRFGWHHEQEAKEWERKGLETTDKYGWMCLKCNQATNDWSPTCPHCNKIGTITYR